MKTFQHDNITENLIVFFHLLRDHGFLIGSREIEDAFTALKAIELLDEETVKETLKVIFCTSKVERERLEYLFRQYIFNKSEHHDPRFATKVIKKIESKEQVETYDSALLEKNDQQTNQNEATVTSGQDSTEFIAMLNENDSEKEAEESALQYAINIIQQKPRVRKIFVPTVHFTTMMQAARIFISKTNRTYTRRKVVVKTGNTLDIRKTIRKSLSTGGIPIDRVLVGRKRKASNIIFFIDGSRSMANFAKGYVQFAYALSHYMNDIEIFLFSTQLKRVTRQLRFHHERQFPVLTLNENEWEGGTCIGESLARFIYDDGKLLTKDTVCMIASDGLDAGDVTYMHQAMETIHRRSRFVLWFNPLLNMDRYKPTAKGMSIALPFIDLLSEAVDANGMLRMANKLHMKR